MNETLSTIIAAVDPKGDHFILDLVGALMSYIENDFEIQELRESPDTIIYDALYRIYEPHELSSYADELRDLGFSDAADRWEAAAIEGES